MVDLSQRTESREGKPVEGNDEDNLVARRSLTEQMVRLIISYLHHTPRVLGKLRAIDTLFRDDMRKIFQQLLLDRVSSAPHHEMRIGALRAVARVQIACSQIAVSDMYAIAKIAGRLLDVEEDGSVKRWAMSAMLQIGGFASVATVMQNIDIDSRKIIRKFMRSFAEDGEWMQLQQGEWKNRFTRTNKTSEVDFVAHYLHHSDPEIRACAAHFLMRISAKGNPDAISALASHSDDSSELVRAAIVLTLWTIGGSDDEVAVNAVTTCLRHEDEHTRTNALNFFGLCGHDRRARGMVSALSTRLFRTYERISNLQEDAYERRELPWIT